MQHSLKKKYRRVIDLLPDEESASQKILLTGDEPSSQSIESKESVAADSNDPTQSLTPFDVDHSLPAKCEICGTGGFEDQVLLCDGPNCPFEYHMFCLRPILTEVPEGEWFCPLCSEQGNLSSLTTTLDKQLEPSVDSSTMEDRPAGYQEDSNKTHPEVVGLLKSTRSIGMLVKVFSDEDRSFHTGRILKFEIDAATGRVMHLVQFQR